MAAEFEVIDPDNAVYAEVAGRFDGYNRQFTNWNWTTFSVVCRDGDHVVAAARGITNMGLVEIRGFWVDEDHRGSGLGTKMMRALEVEAVRRGCSRAALDTYSWQAPDFYKRLGFREYGTLEYPNKRSRHYLVKDLAA
ncbi:MAG: GNAT family N-acetyltransferase [Pseudomonadota bacterium]